MALLDHKVILCSLFEEPSNCFPQWLYHFTFPLAVCESSNFSISSPTLNFCVFLFYPPQWVWGGTSWWFWLTVVILSIFSRVYWPFTYASWEKCLLRPLPVLELYCLSSCGWLLWHLYIFWILDLCEICGLPVFSPILWMVFSLLW